MNPRQRRPVNLDLRTIRMPVTAIASILHRVSGVVLFVAIGGLLWLWHLSLSSVQGFEQAKAVATHPVSGLLLWGTLTALLYHLAAGLRHLAMDIGWFEEKESGKRSAVVAIVVAAIAAAICGVVIW